MNIKQIQIINYKNHQNIKLDFVKKVVCLVGLNGVGKTNILDAIHFSCIGKSYFSSADKICLRDGEPFFRIDTTFAEHKVVVTFEKGKRKKIILDDIPVTKLSNFLGNFPVVVIAPDDNILILGGSEERRKFIDQTLIQTDKRYFQYFSEYTKLLQQRNALLKNSEHSSLDIDLLEIYNAKLLEPAKYIHQERNQFIEALIPFFNKAYQAISDNKEQLSVVYKSNLLQKSLEQLFKDSLTKDKILKRTTEGIHKDDLDFLMNDTAVKVYGSQGQQKTYLMALKLAQYYYLKEKLNRPAFFIIDDIFDKLDSKRSKNLIKFVCDNENQVFISHTSKKMLEEEFKDVDFQLIEIQ